MFQQNQTNKRLKFYNGDIYKFTSNYGQCHYISQTARHFKTILIDRMKYLEISLNSN